MTVLLCSRRKACGEGAETGNADARGRRTPLRCQRPHFRCPGGCTMPHAFGAQISFPWPGESYCLACISELRCTPHSLKPPRTRPPLPGTPVLNPKWLPISPVRRQACSLGLMEDGSRLRSHTRLCHWVFCKACMIHRRPTR